MAHYRVPSIGFVGEPHARALGFSSITFGPLECTRASTSAVGGRLQPSRNKRAFYASAGSPAALAQELTNNLAAIDVALPPNLRLSISLSLSLPISLLLMAAVFKNPAAQIQ